MNKDEIARLREAVRLEPVNPARRAKLGEVLLRLGQYADAEILLRDCVRLEQDNPAHHGSLGRALTALGRLHEAEVAFGMAVQHEPDNPDFRAELGRARARQGNHADAETAFQEAVQIAPGNASYQAGVGRALVGQAKYAEAAERLLRATQLDHGNPDYQDALGEALAAQGRHADAEPLFRRAVELDANVASYRLHLGQALLSQARYDEAEAEFQAAIDLDPKSAAAYVGRGQALAGQARYDEAEAEFQAAIDLDPDTAGAHAGRGQALADQARHALAETAFQRAVQVDSGNPQHRLDLGRARAAQAHYAKAAEAFKQAVQDDPDNPQYRADLGRALLSQKFQVEAEQELREAVRLDPENPSYQADLGEALLSRGRFSDAAELFQQAVHRDEDNPGYRAGLARALSGKGDYSEAEKLFRELAQDGHASAEYRAGWGITLSARGRHPEAQRLFREAMRLDAENPEYRALLGRSLLLEGRHHEAQNLFLEAAGLAPGHPVYQADLASALSALGQFSAAEDAILEAVLLDPDNSFHLADLGRVLGAQNRHVEAAAVLQQAVRIDPDNPSYQADLGRALYRQGCNADAEGAFRDALGLDSGNPACLAGLGQALAAQERYADAEGAFREAMEIDPDNPGHPAKLGLVLLKTGELPRAASILRELQQLYPDTADTSAADLQRAVSEAYDDAIVSHACDLADRLSDKLDLRRRGIAWHEYQAHIPIIARSQLKDLRTIYRDWSDARSHEESEPEGTHSSARSYRIRIIGSLCLLAAALATGGSLATDSVPAIPGEARHIAEILSLAVAILGVALPMICLRRYRQGIPQAFRASLALEDQLASLISNLVLEPAVTTAIQVSWKDSAVDRVSVRDGDELSAKAEIANLISTAAKGRLAIALNRRHGAAVALAGPRGSGKTELARMFTELRPPEPPSRKIPLMLWPPAQCDAHTFLLRVLKDLCIGISSIRSGNGKNHERFFYPERRRQRYSQSIIAGGLMGLGLTVLVTRIAEVKISTVIPFMIGCILIVGGVTVLVASRRPQRLRSRVDAPIRRSTIERAAELVTRVEFTDTYTRDAQLGISGYGLSASAKQGSQFARVPLNEIDVVREIRAMVQSVAEEGWQVIIAIDELDKMRDAEEAMAFLDHIKVLFPIHGCSFIVSVSEDAWARFESRGMPRRDTFDSSFDEVVRVKMLTPAESRDFLKRRSSSITDAQALFCHCLSGGLPRDLIRAARLLAHVASRARDKEGSDPPLCDVLTILLWENLEDKLAASGFFARGDRGVGAPIMTPWLDVWPDQEKTERLLADICRSRGQNKSAALSQVASPDPEPEASHQDHIEAYIAVLHTIRQAFWPGGPLTLLGNEPPDSERLLKGFHCIASARWSQASDIGIAWELLHEARRTLKLAPLDTVAAHPAVGSQ